MKRADNQNKGDPQEMRGTVANPHEEITPVNIVEPGSEYPYPPRKGTDFTETPVTPDNPKPENPAGSGNSGSKNSMSSGNPKTENPGTESPAKPGNQATENPVLKNAISEDLATPATPSNVTFPTALAEQAEKVNPKKNAKIIPVSDTRSPTEHEPGEYSDARENAAADVREWSTETRLS